jgi:RHS repeat-associated protein
MVSAGVAGGTEYYQYTADNKRVVTYAANGTATVVIYGAFGEKLSTGGVYKNVYFAGRLIARDALAGQPLDSYFVAVDRLGSVRTSSYLPYGEEISATANGTVKFATYTRDASTGLDYADQRYYTSTFGRFMSADPSHLNIGLDNSESWNKYLYVLGDPINGMDPGGLCDVLLGGITQSKSQVTTDWANTVGAISAFGYAGGTIPSGILSVAAQGLGVQTGATITALQAINLAAAGSGPINIIAFSGGAQAFTSAYNLLSPSIQARIASITYVDPGANGLLASGVPGTSVTLLSDNSDLANLAVQLFTVLPTKYSAISTGTCGHNLDCVINGYGQFLAPPSDSCQSGSGAVLGQVSILGSVLRSIPLTGGLLNQFWWDFPLMPSVSSTIRYDLP